MNPKTKFLFSVIGFLGIQVFPGSAIPQTKEMLLCDHELLQKPRSTKEFPTSSIPDVFLKHTQPETFHIVREISPHPKLKKQIAKSTISIDSQSLTPLVIKKRETEKDLSREKEIGNPHKAEVSTTPCEENAPTRTRRRRDVEIGYYAGLLVSVGATVGFLTTTILSFQNLPSDNEMFRDLISDLHKVGQTLTATTMLLLTASSLTTACLLRKYARMWCSVRQNNIFSG